MFYLSASCVAPLADQGEKNYLEYLVPGTQPEDAAPAHVYQRFRAPFPALRWRGEGEAARCRIKVCPKKLLPQGCSKVGPGHSKPETRNPKTEGRKKPEGRGPN